MPWFRQLDNINFDIDPLIHVLPASIASSHFIYSGPDCVDLGIDPFPRRLPRCISIDHHHSASCVLADPPTRQLDHNYVFSTIYLTAATAPISSTTLTLVLRAIIYMGSLLEYCYDYGRCQPLALFFCLAIGDDAAGNVRVYLLVYILLCIVDSCMYLWVTLSFNYSI
jgi:hypothetical protein